MERSQRKHSSGVSLTDENIVRGCRVAEEPHLSGICWIIKPRRSSCLAAPHHFRPVLSNKMQSVSPAHLHFLLVFQTCRYFRSVSLVSISFTSPPACFSLPSFLLLPSFFLTFKCSSHIGGELLQEILGILEDRKMVICPFGYMKYFPLFVKSALYGHFYGFLLTYKLLDV